MPVVLSTFTNFAMHSNTDAQNFIRTAFSREEYVHDLTFEEVSNLVNLSVSEKSESDVDYALRLLEINFPMLIRRT